MDPKSSFLVFKFDQFIRMFKLVDLRVALHNLWSCSRWNAAPSTLPYQFDGLEAEL